MPKTKLIMDEDAEQEYNRLIWPVKTACRIFGSWPEFPPTVDVDDALRTPRRRAHQVLALVVMLITVFGSTTESIMLWGEDMNEMIECSLVCSAFYISLLRIVVFTYYEKDFAFVLREMRHDWKESTENERLILREKSRLSFKFVKFFATNTYLAGTAFAIMPIIDGIMLPEGEEMKKILPFRGYYFFNHTTTPRFQITYAFNSFLGIVGCSTIVGATSFSLVSTIHGAAKFSITQSYFKNLTPADWNSKIEVGKMVQRHQKSIIYAEAVERIINILALAQFVISTGLLCFAGFQLTTMLEDSTRMTKYASFINAAIMELFIFSYSGQNLKMESEAIADVVYSSGWLGIRAASDIQFISMRARKPCTITAGKFYDMSFEPFLKVLSSSFSYFTVLLAMTEE